MIKQKVGKQIKWREIITNLHTCCVPFVGMPRVVQPWRRAVNETIAQPRPVPPRQVTDEEPHVPPPVYSRSASLWPKQVLSLQYNNSTDASLQYVCVVLQTKIEGFPINAESAQSLSHGMPPVFTREHQRVGWRACVPVKRKGLGARQLVHGTCWGRRTSGLPFTAIRIGRYRACIRVSIQRAYSASKTLHGT
jgi:hypothetical protein